jgi:hypothetical protein
MKDGKENLIETETLHDAWKVIEDYEKFLKKEEREFDLVLAMNIARVDPCWFVDERTLELIEQYVFYRPNPAGAFSKKFSDQPTIWISAKQILDGIIGYGGYF